MSRSSSLVPALFALVGTWIGYGIASASQASVDPRQELPALSPGSRDAQADPNLAALLEEVRALGDRIAALAPTRVAAVDQRAPAASDGEPGTARIVNLLERCTTLIERLEATGAPDSSSRLLMPADSSQSKFFEEFDWDEPDARQALTDELLLFSRQQVLDRLGKPDYIDDNTRETWFYKRAESEGTKTELRVAFLDGFVIWTSW